jgi:hypothetical protein
MTRTSGGSERKYLNSGVVVSGSAVGSGGEDDSSGLPLGVSFWSVASSDIPARIQSVVRAIGCSSSLLGRRVRREYGVKNAAPIFPRDPAPTAI